MSTDISAIINSFFLRYSQEFRQSKLEAFEVIMALAMSHAYGCCNPKQWEDHIKSLNVCYTQDINNKSSVVFSR